MKKLPNNLGCRYLGFIMNRKKAVEVFDKAIRRSDEISGSYSAGCMNVAVAVYEISVEQFDHEPSVIALKRPFSLQSTADHFILAFGRFHVGEVRNIESFSDSESTLYVDTKGSFKNIRSILEILYDEEKMNDVGIFKENINRVKESPHYDEQIKNRFKNDIKTNIEEAD